jgi:sortase A
MLAIGLILALFIAYEFLFTGLSESRSQRAQLAQFDQRLRTGTFDNPSAAVPSGPVALLEIPVLGTRQIVSEGSSPSDLRDGPGHLPGTPLPGEFGNAVVLGHNHLYGGPFGGLHTLVPGDQIIAVTGQGRFLYLVTDVQTVSGGQRDVVGASADSRLTLVTSSSVGSSARLAVTAQLDGDPVAIPKRPQTTAGRDELGTTGDILGLPLAVIWRGVLAGTLFAATRLYRRWPRTAAYVITTPIILMALWLLFRSLDLLLPGTL